MLINAIIDFGALLSLIVVVKIQRFVYLVIGNDLNSPLLFFGVNFLNMLQYAFLLWFYMCVLGNYHVVINYNRRKFLVLVSP